MRTEISAIGKQATIRKLLQQSGLAAAPTIKIKAKGECFLALKTMLEGVDFDLTYTPLRHLGYKAALGVMGELYAALSQPSALNVVLGLSKKFCYEDVEQIWEGITAAAKEHGASSLALDLNPSVNGLCISIAAAGVQRRSVLEKIPQSKNMDLICLSGHVGAAYMGLHVLEREKVAFNDSAKQPDLSPYKAVLGSYLSPEVKPDTVSRFVEAGSLPSRGYFVTQGLGATILQLARDTGLGAKIYMTKIPISSQTFAMAEEIDMDALTAAMNGGDDYRFVFTMPIEKHDMVRHDFQDYDIIGHLAKPEVGAVMVTPEGAELEIKAQGF